MRMIQSELNGNLVRIGVLIGLLIPFLAISGPAYAQSSSGTRTVKRTKTVVGHRKVRTSKRSSSKRTTKRSSKRSSSSSSSDSAGARFVGGLIVGIIEAMVEGGGESDAEVYEEAEDDYYSEGDEVESDPILLAEFGASFTQLAPRGPQFDPAMSSYVGLGFAAPNAMVDLGVAFDLPFESTTTESETTDLKHLQIGAAFRMGPEMEVVRPYVKFGLAGYYNREWGEEDVVGVAFNTGVGLNVKLGEVEVGAAYGLDLLTVPEDVPDQEEDKLALVGTRQQIGIQTIFHF